MASRITFDSAADADLVAAAVLDQAEQVAAEAAAAGRTRSTAAQVRKLRRLGNLVAEAGSGEPLELDTPASPVAAAPAWQGATAS